MACRRYVVLVAGACVLWATAAPAAAQTAPAGDISPNVEYITTIPEMTSAISINFIGNTMMDPRAGYMWPLPQ